MAKVTRHGGPSHYDWVPFIRPQIGAVDQCHGGSSITSTPKPPTESELTEQPPESLVRTMENPSSSMEVSESADFVEESMEVADVISSPAAPPKEDVPLPSPKRKASRATGRRKPTTDFDF